MKTRTILKISEDENGNLRVNCPNRNDATMAITDQIHAAWVKGDNGPLDILFSATVHFLALEASGRLEEEYVSHLRSTTPKYREGYRKMTEEWAQRNKNLS